jgi:hypothetical protein
MSAVLDPPFAEGDKENQQEEYGKGDEKTEIGALDHPPEYISIKEGSDILAHQDTDPALTAKMHIVNNVGNPRSAQPPLSLPFQLRATPLISCAKDH